MRGAIIAPLQEWDCRCCYNGLLGGEWYHKFNLGYKADSACNAPPSVSPSPDARAEALAGSRFDVLSNHVLGEVSEATEGRVDGKSQVHMGPPLTLPNFPLPPSSRLLGDEEALHCSNSGYSCQEAGLDVPTWPEHAGFHGSENGTCDEHEDCGGVSEELLLAVDAGDNPEIARLYLADEKAAIVNADRGLLQLLDCRNKVVGQLRIQAAEVLAAVSRLKRR
jgi:hypothetical protein